MRKLVAIAICLLSLSLSVTTGRTCINEARTRTGKKCCEQQLRRVDKRCRELEIYRRDRGFDLFLILAEDKRCSCPSSWGHSKILSKRPIPERLYAVFDEVGNNSVTEYKSGTNWCNKCSILADKEFAPHRMFTMRGRKRRKLEVLQRNARKIS